MFRMSRRSILAAAGLLALRARGESAPAVPSSLDHILLGCGDLDKGIDFVERRLGVRAAFGGVHPGRGTRNALLSLGERHYLEIMAPDPDAKAVQPSAVQRMNRLQELHTPRLITWAAHSDDLDMLANKLRAAGIAFAAPTPGSRTRPDGRTLNWKT